MRYAHIPWAPMFERGKCVSPAFIFRVPVGRNRPKGITGELYANETSGMIEVHTGGEWAVIGKIEDYCARVDK